MARIPSAIFAGNRLVRTNRFVTWRPRRRTGSIRISKYAGSPAVIMISDVDTTAAARIVARAVEQAVGEHERGEEAVEGDKQHHHNDQRHRVVQPSQKL